MRCQGMQMGVISFGDNRPVFGSSASFIRGLIDQAIGMHGEKDYLRHLRYQMEWAYNAHLHGGTPCR
jgi:hypothetical protein